MFSAKRQYLADITLKRYQPYSRDVKSLRKFIKGMWFDPSDDIGISDLIQRMHGRRACIRLRVKEKEAKKLQAMEKKGELHLASIQMLR